MALSKTERKKTRRKDDKSVYYTFIEKLPKQPRVQKFLNLKQPKLSEKLEVILATYCRCLDLQYLFVHNNTGRNVKSSFMEY